MKALLCTPSRMAMHARAAQNPRCRINAVQGIPNIGRRQKSAGAWRWMVYGDLAGGRPAEGRLATAQFLWPSKPASLGPGWLQRLSAANFSFSNPSRGRKLQPPAVAQGQKLPFRDTTTMTERRSTSDRRSGADRRQEEQGPPSNYERRRTVEARQPELTELHLSEEELHALGFTPDAPAPKKPQGST